VFKKGTNGSVKKEPQLKKTKAGAKVYDYFYGFNQEQS